MWRDNWAHQTANGCQVCFLLWTLGQDGLLPATGDAHVEAKALSSCYGPRSPRCGASASETRHIRRGRRCYGFCRRRAIARTLQLIEVCALQISKNGSVESSGVSASGLTSAPGDSPTTVGESDFNSPRLTMRSTISHPQLDPKLVVRRLVLDSKLVKEC